MKIKILELYILLIMDISLTHKYIKKKITYKSLEEEKSYKLLLDLLQYDNHNNNKLLQIIQNNKKYVLDLIFNWKCKWFNKKEEYIASNLPIYNVDYNKNNVNFFKDIIHYKSIYTNFNKFSVNDKNIDYQKKIQNLIDAKNIKLEDLKNKNIPLPIFKSNVTKENKKILNFSKTIKTFTYEIYPTNEQINIFHKWFNECDNVYNYCVQLNKEKRENNIYFDLNYKKSKLDVFNKLYNNNPKPAPYDMLTDEVRSFCSNYNSCLTNLTNGNIKYFELKPKSRFYGRSILIPKNAFSDNAIFPSLIKDKLKGYEKINIELIQCDSRLVYDKYLNKYYLKCPMYVDITPIENRKKIVALDPGEKIFMSYYSFNDCGMIGVDIRTKILKYQTKIKKLQRLISRNKNRKNKKISNKKRLINRLKKYYLDIKNTVKELHNKTALYLVRNYNTILLPKFETSNMIGKTFIKNKLIELKTKPLEIQQIEQRNLTKKFRLAKKVKFVLNQLSHYKFKQHLLHKCKEYGCKLKIVTEEYTSKCCSRCGFLSDIYFQRLKTCSNCNLKIDRDINGSRNILIKNWKGNYK